jgi:hypothetical protein
MSKKKNDDTSTLSPITDQTLIELLAETPAPGQQERPLLGPALVVEGEVVEAGAGAAPVLTPELPSLEIERQLHAVRSRLAALTEIERPGLVRMREELASSVQIDPIDPTAIKKVGDVRILIEEEETILLSRVKILGQALEAARRREAPPRLEHLADEVAHVIEEAAALKVKWDEALTHLTVLTSEFRGLRERHLRCVYEAADLAGEFHLDRPPIFRAAVGEPTDHDLQDLRATMGYASAIIDRTELGYHKRAA